MGAASVGSGRGPSLRWPLNSNRRAPYKVDTVPVPYRLVPTQCWCPRDVRRPEYGVGGKFTVQPPPAAQVLESGTESAPGPSPLHLHLKWGGGRVDIAAVRYRTQGNTSQPRKLRYPYQEFIIPSRTKQSDAAAP
eukprot:scaffold3825_cov62-Phaeocystis_antarctica.AAC.1